MAEIIPIKNDIPDSNLSSNNNQTSNTPVTQNQTNTEIVELNSTTINSADNMAPLPQSSKITADNVDFTRIATSKSNAETGAFIKESSVKKEYWTNLEYQLDENGIVEIYNNGTLIAFTDKQGINLNSNTVPQPEVTPIVQEVTPIEPETTTEVTPQSPEVIPVSANVTPSINNNDIILGIHETTGNTTYTLEPEVYAMLAYVMQHEAIRGSYEDCLATLSCILNRVEDPRYPNNVYDVLIAPGQFEVWNEDAFTNWNIEKADPCVIAALNDGLNNGKRNVDTVEWRANFSTDIAYNGDRKFQVADNGNKYFHKAVHIDRIDSAL